MWVIGRHRVIPKIDWHISPFDVNLMMPLNSIIQIRARSLQVCDVSATGDRIHRAYYFIASSLTWPTYHSGILSECYARIISKLSPSRDIDDEYTVQFACKLLCDKLRIESAPNKALSLSNRLAFLNTIQWPRIIIWAARHLSSMKIYISPVVGLDEISI